MSEEKQYLKLTIKEELAVIAERLKTIEERFENFGCIECTKALIHIKVAREQVNSTKYAVPSEFKEQE